MKSKRLVVTGAEGHIGRAICEIAQAAGHQVVKIDVTAQSGLPSIDVRNTKALARAIEGADVVFHSAGLHAPHVGVHTEEMFWSVNVDGTASVLRAMARAGVEHLVFTSTTAVYGNGAADAEPARWIDDRSATQPRTVYHRTKLAAEAFVQDAAASGIVRAAIIRLGRCFPEPLNVMAVHRLCRGLDRQDAATAHLCALEHTSSMPEPLIVAARTPFKKEDCILLGFAADEVIEHRCRGLKEIFVARGWSLPKRIDRIYDSSRAQLEWGWRPDQDVWSLLRQHSET